MKRLFSAILLSIFALALVLAPLSTADASDSGQIYDSSSTGDMVVRIQMRLRELGYLNFKPTGSYKSMTVSAVKAFQKNYRDSGYEMQVDGRMGQQSLELLFKYEAKRASLGGVSIPAGPKHSSNTLEKTGAAVPWDTVKTLLNVGEGYVIIDCYTGYPLELIFAGGNNHAEMEAEDTSKLEGFKRICGDEYNYLKRPVVVIIGEQEIAASIQCWPHGSDTVGDNGMAGHVCLFFEGSLSEVGSLPDVEHNENVHKASGQ